MQCAKVQLQERSKPKIKIGNEKSKRFCQKRMVNPEHDEDVRWTGIFDRFHCNNLEEYNCIGIYDSVRSQATQPELYLSVQNLQFQGNVKLQQRHRNSFKYKTLSNNQKHRMFVKQVVDDVDQYYAGSELSDYFDDYSKYFSNNEQSCPSSGKSSIVLNSLSNKSKENKATQVDLRAEVRKKYKFEPKTKKVLKNNGKPNVIDSDKNAQDNVKDTKVAFHNNGKRKSLTISRTASPATVQVIRVDVVFNYSSSSVMSDYEENKKQTSSNDIDKDDHENKISPKKSRFVNKYMLTNTVKTLDEHVSGSKVTLMCKTFKLANRSKM